MPGKISWKEWKRGGGKTSEKLNSRAKPSPFKEPPRGEGVPVPAVRTKAPEAQAFKQCSRCKTKVMGYDGPCEWCEDERP